VKPAPLVPPRVRPGDAVAIVSPSAPGIALWPHRADRGARYLESLGLRVKVMPNASGADGWVSASAKARADDIHRAFADDEVAVVLASTGGNHSNQLLPHLDYDLIASHPKVFQGYSDVSLLHWAFLKFAGLRTFHGPVLAVELGEFPHPFEYTDSHLRAAWFAEEPLRFEAAPGWTDEFVPWNGRDDVVRARELRPSSGWKTLSGGVAEGPLLGGAIETICWHVKGSETWIDPSGAILVLESSPETPSPGHVDAYLTDLEQLGVLDSLAALVVGRPIGFEPEDVEALWRTVAERTRSAGIPVLVNVDVGHADPMLTLPLGAPARLDADEQVLELLEPATAEPGRDERAATSLPARA
jgi:muramoyltetrapeptide carboxypeptidase